ncbi:hypothetical protein OEZ86_009283 [Tetradesmus obliquus]|nr:hypothetical protein OEZ86_009283 [Tetradesmus obliquus]
MQQQAAAIAAGAAAAAAAATAGSGGAAAGEDGAAGEPAKKRRRRRKGLVGDLNVALYIKQQQARGSTRKWRQQWVSVRTIVGGGEVKMLKWVSDTPPSAPTTTIPGFANFQGFAAASKRKEKDPSKEAAKDAAAVAAAGAAGRFGCPTCGKSYTSLGSLRKHMHVHGEKSFSCTFPGCKKSFADAEKLEKHAIKHTASKDIQCEACGKCFFTVFNLRTHWKQLHKHLPMPASVMTKTAAAGTTPAASSAAAGSDAS